MTAFQATNEPFLLSAVGPPVYPHSSVLEWSELKWYELSARSKVLTSSIAISISFSIISVTSIPHISHISDLFITTTFSRISCDLCRTDCSSSGGSDFRFCLISYNLEYHIYFYISEILPVSSICIYYITWMWDALALNECFNQIVDIMCRPT